MFLRSKRHCESFSASRSVGRRSKRKRFPVKAVVRSFASSARKKDLRTNINSINVTSCNTTPIKLNKTRIQCVNKASSSSKCKTRASNKVIEKTMESNELAESNEVCEFNDKSLDHQVDATKDTITYTKTSELNIELDDKIDMMNLMQVTSEPNQFYSRLFAQSGTFDNPNLSKCISECDSTTDCEQLGDENSMPDIISSAPVSTKLRPKIIIDRDETIESEVDSTTDLIPDQIMCGDADDPSLDSNKFLIPDSYVNNNVEKDQPKLFFPLTTTSLNQMPSLQNNPISSNTMFTKPNTAINSTNNNLITFASPSTPLSSSTTSTTTNYPSTPDVIAFIDEEMNRNPIDIYQYTDFMPYTNLTTNIISHVLMNCGSESCTSQSYESNLASFNDTAYMTMNQTLDSLKALSDLNHTTSFLAGITCPKPQMFCNTNDDINKLENCNLSASNDLYVDLNENDDDEDVNDTRQEETTWSQFDAFAFIKSLPPPTLEMISKCPALPLKTRSSPEFSLVLDLDETLVHCSLQELSDASFKFPVLFQVTIN